MAGRSTPVIRPRLMSAPAMTAPLLPAESIAAASPSLVARIARTRLLSGFRRTACAGWSSMVTTSEVATMSISTPEWSADCRAAWISRSSPYSCSDVPKRLAPETAPATTTAGPWSPPIASTAITGLVGIGLNLQRLLTRPAVVSLTADRYCLDVEVLDILCVRLNEFSARWNRGAHEHVERFIGSLSVVDSDLDQGSAVWVHCGFPELNGVHLAKTLVSLQFNVFSTFLHDLRELPVVVHPLLTFATADAKERWLGDVDVAFANERLQVPVEECEEQCANVRTVNIGIGHDDDSMVAEFGKVKLFAHRCSKSGDDGTDFIVLKHLVEPRLFHIEDLASKWKDGLEAPLATLFC